MALQQNPRPIVSTDEELIRELQAENIRLRETLKLKFDNCLKENQPEIVVNTSDTFEDIMPDRKL